MLSQRLNADASNLSYESNLWKQLLFSGELLEKVTLSAKF